MELWTQEMQVLVKHALMTDIGSGDITAALIDEHEVWQAKIITREAGVICGVACVAEVYQQVDAKVLVTAHVADGDLVSPDQVLLELSGPARSLLTGERVALNFLQTISATASAAYVYANQIAHTKAKILDTRKTIPGLRHLQKYAVRCGGGVNHRHGLYDAFLIKENHIMACGSISAAVARARKAHPDRLLEVEVERLDELKQALDAGVDRVMLDNFSLSQVKEAVALTNGKVPLEVSGNVDFETITAYAEVGVDYISLGALTKHIHAMDLSMRLQTV